MRTREDRPAWEHLRSELVDELDDHEGFAAALDDLWPTLTPETLLAQHAPYRNTVGVFTSGSLDAKYGPGATRIADAARASGMTVTRVESPGTAHDWATVRWSLAHGLPFLGAHLGLQRAA